MRTNSRTAFTLIELMIIVAIIGVLAAIAIPKFADMILKSKEGACRGNLATIRSALKIYYGDTEGEYPDDLTFLTLNGKYLSVIPSAEAVGHHTASSAQQLSRIDPTPGDSGGWFYDDIPTSGDYGRVIVNCFHTDTKGVAWSAY